MKAKEVKIGGTYKAKVSDKIVTIKIVGTHHRKGWNAINLETKRTIHVKTAARLRAAV